MRLLATTGRRRRNFYSQGELNAIVDSVFHPLAKRNPWFILLDGLLHAIMEEDPTTSVLKFVRYNTPVLFDLVKRRIRDDSS